MLTFSDAVNIAAEAHKHQHRKDGVTPYIFHSLRVGYIFWKQYLNSLHSGKEIKLFFHAAIVAVLHDVIEDCSVFGYDLKYFKLRGFSEEVLEALQLLTKKRQHSYSEYIDCISKNKLATIVKIEDIKDNIQNIQELPTTMNKQEHERYLHKREKYTKSLDKLTKSLADE